MYKANFIDMYSLRERNFTIWMQLFLYKLYIYIIHFIMCSENYNNIAIF